jgi:predicted DsbA family dithiol-disulfide isomerase
MKTLEIFSDFVWPWCYFITGRIEKLKKEYEISVRWRAFPLHPETPEQGISLEQLFAGHPLDMQEIGRTLTKTAEEAGLPFRASGMIYNSRLAQELALWSESKNRGDEFHAAVFKAYFVDNKNIAEIPVLVELASSVELPGDEAAEILTNRTFKAAVDSDWALSREKSITAVPTLVINQDRLVGAQPCKIMEALMHENGVKKRA